MTRLASVPDCGESTKIDGAASEDSCWHVVFCKPNQEPVARESLKRQDFHVYLPRLQTRKRRGGKWAETHEPLFPRYLFIRINPKTQSTASVRSTRGAIGLVRIGGLAARVPHRVIEAIKRQEDAVTGLHRDSGPLFDTGSSIKLVDGPLAGMEGIFGQKESGGRVTILMNLLGKTNKITVQRDWVAKAG